jgi:glyoxylase-like metal-dependent hydrolase (beta-lactamase superfamily II)
MQENLRDDQKEFGEQFIKLLRSIAPISVNLTVKDGDEMDWCGGCRVIATPGHMPGHISLYLPKQKVLITGDAMAIEGGIPVIANLQFVLDEETAKQSLQTLLGLEVDSFLCYHGGTYTP